MYHTREENDESVWNSDAQDSQLLFWKPVVWDFSLSACFGDFEVCVCAFEMCSLLVLGKLRELKGAGPQLIVF